MILLRALNEYDILGNCMTNGLASKKLIYDITKNYCLTRYQDILCKMNEKQQDEFFKSQMKEYLISHEYKLKKIYQRQHQKIKDILVGVNSLDAQSVIKLFNIMSTLNNHLVNGSKTLTPWISTTKSISSLAKYYESQPFHHVAVIKSNINKIVDFDYVIGADLSERQTIEDNMFLVNKINCPIDDIFQQLATEYPGIYMDYLNGFVSPTNDKFMGYNFAMASKEVSFYDYIPSSHIIGKLDALGFDLAKKGIFNFNVFSLEPKTQEKSLLEFKLKILKYLQNHHDEKLVYLFSKLYMNNENIKSAVSVPENDDNIILGKRKILCICQNIHDIHIKN